MRIFSKRAFAIGPGASRGSTEVDYFTTKPNAFQDIPDKYVNDKTFKAALKAGDITIIDGSNKEVPNPTPVEEPGPMSEAQEFAVNLKAMDRDTTFAFAEEKYGLTINDGEKLGEFKKRILAAYKASVTE